MNIMQMLVDDTVNYKYNDDFQISFIDKESSGNIFLVVEVIYKHEFYYTIMLYLSKGIPRWCICSKDGTKYDTHATMTNYPEVLSFIEHIQNPL